MARSLGFLFVFGPACALVQFAFSANHYRHLAAFALACLAWTAGGLALLTGGFDSLPRGAFKALLFSTTAVVSVAVYAAGGPGGGMYFYYLWLTPYAFVFFSRRFAAAQVALVGTSMAVILILQIHAHPSLGPVTSHLPLEIGVLTTLIVIGTLARRLTSNVAEAERRFRRGFDDSPLGLAFVATDGTWLDVNDALCRIVGRPRADVLAAPLSAVFDADFPIGIGRRWDTTHGADLGETVAILHRPAGDDAWVAATVVPVTTPEGDSYFYLQLSDITANRRDRDMLVHQALHDPLTGLFNRVVFMDRLAAALDRRSTDGSGVAVVLTDFDRFKVLNDSLGHHVGDEVLVTVAPRLTDALAPGDLLARLGGDEFVMLCEGISGPNDALDRARRLAEVLIEPVELDSGSHVVSASFGVALAEGSDITVTNLLANADAAMYRAKALGRGRIEMFDAALRIQADSRLSLEREMRAALREGQFRLEYQPIIDAHTGRAVTLEALVRWDHPTLGMLGPDRFIPLAEETGLICDIGAWVLQTACAQLACWQVVLPPRERPLHVTVNVSARQLAQPDFVGFVAETFHRTRVAPGTVGLEITESVLAAIDQHPGAKLRALKSLGMRLVLDDFGTGYSSLAYLKRFPVDSLKIDRSFVAGLGTAEDTAIVETVVRLAQALGLDVIAEGVETSGQLERLRDMGCHLVQGFLLARPLSSAGALLWLVEHSGPGVAGLARPTALAAPVG